MKTEAASSDDGIISMKCEEGDEIISMNCEEPLEEKDGRVSAQGLGAVSLENHYLQSSLRAWLTCLNLERCTDSAYEWCKENGACKVEEILMFWEEEGDGVEETIGKGFCDRLDLTPLENRRIQEYYRGWKERPPQVEREEDVLRTGSTMIPGEDTCKLRDMDPQQPQTGTCPVIETATVCMAAQHIVTVMVDGVKVGEVDYTKLVGPDGSAGGGSGAGTEVAAQLRDLVGAEYTNLLLTVRRPTHSTLMIWCGLTIPPTTISEAAT